MIEIFRSSQIMRCNTFAYTFTQAEAHTHIQKISHIQQLRSCDLAFNVETCKLNSNLLLQLECPVCSKILTDPVQLNCKHMFCQKCAQKCLDQYKSCPLCRKKCRKYKGEYQVKKQSTTLRTIRNKIKSLTFSCEQCKWKGKFAQFYQKFGEAPCIDVHDWSVFSNLYLKGVITKQEDVPCSHKNQNKLELLPSQIKLHFDQIQLDEKQQMKIDFVPKQYRNQSSIYLNNSKYDNQNIFIQNRSSRYDLQVEFMQSDSFKEYFRLNYYL